MEPYEQVFGLENMTELTEATCQSQQEMDELIVK